MIKVYSGWEHGRICFDLDNVATVFKAQITEDGFVNSTCFVDITPNEAKQVLEDLQRAIQEYEKSEEIFNKEIEDDEIVDHSKSLISIFSSF